MRKHYRRIQIHRKQRISPLKEPRDVFKTRAKGRTSRPHFTFFSITQTPMVIFLSASSFSLLSVISINLLKCTFLYTNHFRSSWSKYQIQQHNINTIIKCLDTDIDIHIEIWDWRRRRFLPEKTRNSVERRQETLSSSVMPFWYGLISSRG